MILAHLALLAQKAPACAVCFSGKAEGVAGLVSGITWGIFILLAATFSAMAGLVAVVVKIEKQRAAAEAQ